MEQALLSVSSRSISKLLETIFTKMGYSVRSVRRYYDVIDESKSAATSVIVVSDTVSNRDGYDLARRIKNFDATNTKKVIIVNINRRLVDAPALETQLIYPLAVPFREEDVANILQRTARKRRSIVRSQEKKVLAFIPHRTAARTFERTMQECHFKCETVASLSAFKERVTAARAHALVMDTTGNRRECYALARDIRATDRYKTAPLVFLTSRNLLEEHLFGFDYGVIDFFPLPLNGRHLFDHLSMVFDNIASPGISKSLVISSDDAVRHTLGYVLAKNRFSFREARTPDEALRIMKKQKIDAVVLDLETNRETTLSVIKAMRMNHSYDDISAIAIVRRATIGLIDAESSLGINDYMLKPFDEIPFIRRLKNNLILKNVIDNIEYQNKQLIAVNKRHNDLLTFTGYDVKGPLSLIRNYTKLIIEKPDLPRENIVSSVKAIDRQARLAGRIIDTTIHYKNIETGKVTLDKTSEDIVELLNRCLSDNMMFLENRNLKIRIEVRDAIPPMRIDQMKIYEVFTNLLHNSIKHSAQGDNIVVTVGMLDYQDEFYSLSAAFGEEAKRLNKYIEIRFIDEGRSLSDHVKGQIFNLVIKNTEGTQDDKNLNIGLHIVRTIVSAHGGKVWVESEDGGGNAFIMLLPVVG